MGHELINSAGITFNASGKFGSSAVFDGIGYAYEEQAGRIAPGGTFTIECWAKPNIGAFPNSARFVVGIPQLAQIRIAPDGSALALLGSDGGAGSITTTPNINNNQWHHLALVANGASGLKLFVDGVQAGTSAVDMGTLSTNEAFALGIFTPFGIDGTKYIGELDDVAVWSTARYTSAFTPPATPINSTATGLVALYAMNNNLTQTQGVSLPVAPTVTTAPAIVGTPQAGVASSYTAGTFTGSPTPAMTQQWTLDGVDISGSTGATYTPVSGDVGKALRVRQIATNSEGSANSTSASATITAAQSGGSATPTSSTINIKTVGAGRDFATVGDVDAYIASLDCVALGKMTVIYVYDDLNVTGRHFAPATHNANAYVVMYPAPGQGVNDGLTDAYTGNYGSTGVTLSMTGDRFTVGRGMSVQGFRVRGILNSSSNYTYSLVFGPGRNSGADAEFAYNRVWITCSGVPAIFSSEYNALCHTHDNYFLFDGAYTGTVWQTFGQVDVQRNTFVRKNGGVGTGSLIGSNNTFRDNVLLGFGPDAVSGPGNFANRANNYVDTVQTNADAAFIYGSTASLVVSVDDARPALGSPLIGGGSSTAVSINDLRGGNRGPTPDAGAFQRTAATPLVVATVTSQVIDGQSLIISGTTTNTPTSSLLTLAPAATPNGAQFYGPLTVTLGSGSFTVTVDDITPGNYVPSMSMTNAGGTSMVNGLAGFEIMGVESVAQDPVNAGPATAFTWIPPTNGTAGVQTASFAVGVDGVLSSTVRFTPSDNGAGGSFTPTSLDLTPGTPSGTLRYMRPTAGSSSLSGSGTGLLNAPLVTFVAAAAQTVPSAAPTISISTAANAVLSGKNATISGPANLQGDAMGSVSLFLDPQPSGTPISLGSAPVASGIWIKQAVVPAGLFRLRAVATANGQTASASTTDLRVLGLTGTVGVPVA